jgi:hypothetical protein
MWIKEWPTKEGFYWAYGDVFGCREDRFGEPYRKLELAQVRKISNGVIHIVSGQFAFPKEAGLVWWSKIDEPVLPQEEEED